MRSTKQYILPLVIICTASVSAQKDRCSLCPFGESPGFPDRVIPGRGRTCAETSFLNFPEDSEECSRFRKTASWCGCPSAPQECFLCEKGDSSPTPDLRSPLFPDTSCLDYEFLASQLTAEECPSLQQRAGSFDVSSFCSCEATPAPKVCELCPGGVLVNPSGNSVVPGYTCEEVDQGLLQFFSTKSLCIEFRQVLLANNLCECVGSTDYPTAAPTTGDTEAPTKAPSTNNPTAAPIIMPTEEPTKATKTQKPKPTDAPSPAPTSEDDSNQSATGSPTVSEPSPPTMSPTRGIPSSASKGSSVPTLAPTPTVERTTSTPTSRSFKGSFTPSFASAAPTEAVESTGKGSKGKGSKGWAKNSSKSTKKETKKLGDKGIEKKLKAKSKSKTSRSESSRSEITQ